MELLESASSVEYRISRSFISSCALFQDLSFQDFYYNHMTSESLEIWFFRSFNINSIACMRPFSLFLREFFFLRVILLLFACDLTHTKMTSSI